MVVVPTFEAESEKVQCVSDIEHFVHLFNYLALQAAQTVFFATLS